ncbi:hypothetical protein ACFOKF_16575 [Sphingobium rhizovicinum]|uniref:Uncharacterized protein n=1 Tax=Sphingobium rhizovicinum TaxID=432308 RepID=A0ABV7NK92_9SPHN
MATEEKPVLQRPGGGMATIGLLLALAGVIGALIGLTMDTSIASSGYLSGPREVINFDLQQQQMIILLLSAAGFLSGTILFAIGRAVQLLARSTD